MATRILFADDEDDVRALVRDQLSGEGFQVETAADGNEAMSLLRQQHFDLVLLDIKMPGKDGLEVLAFMKQEKLSPRTIMLTAVDELSVAIRAVKMGANDYITKPYALEDLVSSIRRALQR